MLKQVREYLDQYGDVPEDEYGRVCEILGNRSLSKYKLNIFSEMERIHRIKKETISFIIYQVPKPTPRPRYSGKTYCFYVKGASDNRKLFEEWFVKEDIKLITTPTTFQCVTYLPIPESMSVPQKVLAELGYISPISKPDWDNLAKTYCDMIQGTLLYDDALIVEGSLLKRYSTKPRIEITISYLSEFDSSWNERKILKKGKR